MTNEELLKRTKQFAIEVSRLDEILPPRLPVVVHGKHLMRSASLIGINLNAAYRAKSTGGLNKKLNTAIEKAYESIYILEILIVLEEMKEKVIKKLIDEAHGLLDLLIATLVQKDETNQQSSR
jgi:four helix bundle protein